MKPIKAETELVNPVTIIIPIYNHEQFIARCLDSIENQEYPKDKIAIIVVDDGSTDRSLKIASEYNVRVLRQQHLGPGAARNKGTVEANTNIIAFLDADDTADKYWLVKTIDYFNRHDPKKIAGVGCSHGLLNNDRDSIRFAWLEHTYRHSRLPERVTHIGTSGAIYQKCVIEKIGGFDTSLLRAQDMDLSSRVVHAGYELHFINEPLIRVEYPKGLLQYLKSQVKKIAYMVMFYFKRDSIRSGKGSYSNYSEYIQGLLPLLFLLAGVLLQDYRILYAFAFWILVIVILNIPFLRFVSKRRNMAKVSHFWPFSIMPYIFFRSMAWCTGLIYGIVLVFKRIIFR